MLDFSANPIDLQLLIQLHDRHQTCRSGAIANHIPELAKMNPDAFSISVASVDGDVLSVGDDRQLFTIQSISKVFTYGMALEDRGRDTLLSKVGVELTGDLFNSIIRLDENSKRPDNPMVNAGAIATTNLIQGHTATDGL